MIISIENLRWIFICILFTGRFIVVLEWIAFITDSTAVQSMPHAPVGDK